MSASPQQATVRERWRRIIFESDTPAGRAFDVLLIIAISMSVAAVLLDSIRPVREQWGYALWAAEWFFTLLFTFEYGARLWVVEDKGRYAKSFFGLIDLLAIIPTYLSILFPGTEFLLVIRLVRVLRVFRILKLLKYMEQASILSQALQASRPKILIFIFAILVMVTIAGSLMYLIEGEEYGFTSIPISMYWAIVTLTTVGYGDISPHTPIGRLLASMLMLTGYGIIAVPTGIVTVELSRAALAAGSMQCPQCLARGHTDDANFCRVCGASLPAAGAPKPGGFIPG
jgi:voltage-gated potassium channel